MAGALYHAVPGGGESSDSDDNWNIADSIELQEKMNKMQTAETNESLLKNALTLGNVKLVEELLDAGLSVECWFQFGWTPLMYAASVANLEIVRILLNRGANSNFERDKFTVLMAACSAHANEENIVKCVELLLSRNVDANLCCRKSMTALMLAAKEGHTRVVTLLVAHCAEINAQDGSGFTALTWAAHNGHKNTVLRLLELGSDKNLSAKSGSTPADVARRNNHLEIFSILSFSGNPNQGIGVTNEDAMYRYLKVQPELPANNNLSSLASSDLEVFLHGMDLGHLSDVLMENVTLRQLLSLDEGDLKKVGVTDDDCKKLLSAVREIQSEETKLEMLPILSNAESSSDELLEFLLKLNRQCFSLTHALEAVNNKIPVNPQKVVLEWDSTQNILTVCEDLVTSVADLNKEMGRLRELLQKFQNGQKSNPCRMPSLEEQNSWKWSKLLKRTTLTVFGLGFIISVVSISVKRKLVM